jgi:hypothetical protein
MLGNNVAHIFTLCRVKMVLTMHYIRPIPDIVSDPWSCGDCTVIRRCLGSDHGSTTGCQVIKWHVKHWRS